MPSVLTFTQPLNVSLQVGDTAYYVPTSTSGGYSINSSSVVEIGVVTNITGLVVTVGTQINNPPNGAYILFSKDNKANLSSILGYYADIQFKNDSKQYAEVYSVGVDTFNSSK